MAPSSSASIRPRAPSASRPTDTGRVLARAMTIPVGPGYHTYVVGLLRRLGDGSRDHLDAGLAVGRAAAEDADASTDPTGAFFSGERADAERGHLVWLRSSLLAVRDGRRQGATGSPSRHAAGRALHVRWARSPRSSARGTTRGWSGP